jgi:hypothetical protein
MSDPNPAPPAAAPAPSGAAVSPAIEAAARWFWWIAGLSLVNTVLARTGSDTNFVIGLGLTELADAMFAHRQAIGYLVDAAALGFFVAMGQLARSGKAWAFYLGGVVYAFDALIYVRLGAWMPVGFHAFALFFIAQGAIRLGRTSN